MKRKLIRTSTVALSLDIFSRGFLKELTNEYDVMAISSNSELLDEISRRENVRVCAVEMPRRISPIMDIKAIVRMTRIFLEEKPDIVHSMTPKAGLVTMVSARLARVPIRLHTFTGLLFPTSTGLRRCMLRQADKMICRCATHIIAEGEGVKNDLAQHVTTKQITVLGNGNVRGIDLKYYRSSDDMVELGSSIRNRVGAEMDSFVFIYVGRINVDKGITELVKSFVCLAAANPQIRLIMVGGDENEPSGLSQEISDVVDSHPQITCVNWVGDVRPYYAAADCLLLPSYREGFPNSVLEAGAMGLPSIVTDVNGSREIISNGYNGLVVNPHSIEELTEAMRYAIAHMGEMRQMGLRAREIVSLKYEVSYVRQCQKDYYVEILG